MLVVDQLEHANELAKRLQYSYKIVTLDGDIVHRGGSMTGGTTRNATTPMNVQRELRQVKENLEGQYLKVSDLRSQFQALSSRKESQSTQMVQLRIALAQLDSVLQVKRGKYEGLLADYEQLAPQDREEEGEIQLADELVVAISEIHSRIDDLTMQMRTKRSAGRCRQRGGTPKDHPVTCRELSALKQRQNAEVAIAGADLSGKRHRAAQYRL
ncbi:MAG: hypothetical protein ACLVJ6_00080 [Merdibacter sp.]